MTSVQRVPIVAILGLCLFLAGVASAAITPYRGIVAIDGLGMGNDTYAIVLALSSVGAALGSVALGQLSDKVRDRRLIVIGCALLGALAFGLIFVNQTQFAYTFAVCVILPFGAALFSQSFAFARTYLVQSGAKNTEFLISALRSLFTFAWVVTPPMAGWIAATHSVFAVFGIAALAQLCCMLAFVYLYRRDDAKVARTEVKPLNSEGEEQALPVRRIVGLVGVTFLRITLVLSLTTFPLVLTNDIGGSLADLGIAASLAAALEVPFMLAWGYAATRWPREPIIALNGLIFAAYLVALSMAGDMQTVLMLQVVNAVGTAGLMGLTISYVQDAIRGRVGLSTSLIDVVGVVATFATAGLFALLTRPEHYADILYAGGALGVIGAAMLMASWSRRPSEG